VRVLSSLLNLCACCACADAWVYLNIPVVATVFLAGLRGGLVVLAFSVCNVSRARLLFNRWLTLLTLRHPWLVSSSSISGFWPRKGWSCLATRALSRRATCWRRLPC
jgi:hypothetical protein